jgi:hypothetical protein
MFSYSQIKIDDVGDGWKSKVDSAILIIKTYDQEKYKILIDNCEKIEFILGDYSTTKPPKTIAITTNDAKSSSINNIAAILVHESFHLMVWNSGVKMNPNLEEKEAYKWEYYFLCKLPEVEDWLFLNAINKIILFSQ